MKFVLARIAESLLLVVAGAATLAIGMVLSTAAVWLMVVVGHHTLQFLNSLIS